MAQYFIADKYVINGFTLTDGVDTYRLHIRSATLCIDKTLTGLGFAGAKDTDWENVYQVKHETSTWNKFRIGVRTAKLIIDQALTAIAFGGIENVDWVNLEQYSPNEIFRADSSIRVDTSLTTDTIHL